MFMLEIDAIESNGIVMLLVPIGLGEVPIVKVLI